MMRSWKVFHKFFLTFFRFLHKSDYLKEFGVFQKKKY